MPKTLQNSNNNVNDVGGAVINLKYTPVAGAPVINNLHWIQALNAYYDSYGAYVPGNFQTRLDNPFATGTPFYDDGGAAGTLAGGGGYFADRPWAIETEGLETNPVADVQFQVVVADLTTTVTDDVTSNVVTLYGGEWWGYQYTASDVPEPTTIIIWSLLGAVAVTAGWRWRKAG